MTLIPYEIREQLVPGEVGWEPDFTSGYSINYSFKEDGYVFKEKCYIKGYQSDDCGWSEEEF